ncbi:hypothetical protein ACFO3O_18655 [Dokdonia ponticola]|uniref:EF-hand domain-containing protein n=1 Tax=Dokdonia ponticola TaxID=2041041 RepID=A0ABV9I0V3_9FLAO
MIGLFAFSVLLIKEMRWRDYDSNDEGILSEEKIEELQKENKREQVISYKTARLVDTINTIYIIPVSHKTLNEEEDIVLNGLLSASGSEYNYEPDFERRYSKYVYGDYNNLIVYNKKENTTQKLLNDRANFKDYREEYFNDDILLLFKVAEKDTYKDGVINLNDFKSLCIYSFEKEKLEKITLENMDVVDYQFFYGTKELIVRFGVDKNNDGRYTEFNEPSIIKKYNLDTQKLTDIIDPTLNNELQKTLEGTK